MVQLAINLMRKKYVLPFKIIQQAEGKAKNEQNCNKKQDRKSKNGSIEDTNSKFSKSWTIY